MIQGEVNCAQSKKKSLEEKNQKTLTSNFVWDPTKSANSKISENLITIDAKTEVTNEGASRHQILPFLLRFGFPPGGAKMGKKWVK